MNQLCAHRLRRAPLRTTTLAATVLCVLTLGAVPAANADPNADPSAHSPAAQAAHWLSRQLVDGAFDNPLKPTLPDYGLMLDALFATHAAGRGSLADGIVTRLDARGEARRYFTYYGFGQGQDWLANEGLDDRVAGATAKLLVGAQVSGRDPRSFGGYDLVAETERLIVRNVDVVAGGRFAAGSVTNPAFSLGTNDIGRVVDYGPTTSSNGANTFAQGLAVMGLAGVHRNDAAAIDALLRQQCSDGYFRIFYSTDPATGQTQTCDAGRDSDVSPADRDATAISISGLLAAEQAGATTVRPAIDRAVAWLQRQAGPHGGWGGGVGTESANTNSTGLVVQALAAAGADPTVLDRGTAFLVSAQVPSNETRTPLAQHRGAVAYSPADLATGRAEGIAGMDTWVRASAQATLGLSRVSFWQLMAGPRAEPPTGTTRPAVPPPAVSATPTRVPSRPSAPVVRRTPTPRKTAVPGPLTASPRVSPPLALPPVVSPRPTSSLFVQRGRSPQTLAPAAPIPPPTTRAEPTQQVGGIKPTMRATTPTPGPTGTPSPAAAALSAQPTGVATPPWRDWLVPLGAAIALSIALSLAILRPWRRSTH